MRNAGLGDEPRCVKIAAGGTEDEFVPAAPRKAPDPERRKLRRTVKRIIAAFEADGVRGKGHLKNISKQGLFLRSGTLPEPGANVRILFHDRSGSKIEVSGKVCWTTEQLPLDQQAKPGFGVVISSSDAAFREFYEQILVA